MGADPHNKAMKYIITGEQLDQLVDGIDTKKLDIKIIQNQLLSQTPKRVSTLLKMIENAKVKTWW